MFRVLSLAFWILHVELSISAPPTDNAAIRAEASAASHPFLTGVKFVPFKTARPKNVAELEPIPSANKASARLRQSAPNNAPDANLVPRVRNFFPSDSSSSTRLLDKFSPLPSFETKKFPSAEENGFAAVSNENGADSATLTTDVIEADNGKAARLAAAAKFAAPLDVAADDAAAAKLISEATFSPVSVGRLKNLGDNRVSDQPLPSAFPPSASSDQLNDARANLAPLVSAFRDADALPFPDSVFDAQLAVSRKLVPPEPEPISTNARQAASLRPSERITLPERSPAPQTPPPPPLPPKNLLAVYSPNLPADVKLTPIATPRKVPAAVATLETEILPPKEENVAELIDTLSSAGYDVAASRMAALVNASAVKADLPLIFQRLTAPPKAPHSPKKDVEVFAPPQAENPALPPLQPGMPAFPPQYPFSPDGGAYPADETPPFVVNDYPAYPPFLPEETPAEKPFTPTPVFPTPPPTTTRSTPDVARPTEDTTRATEETTPKLPKSAPTLPKFAPRVPNNAPFAPKNAPATPKNAPATPKYAPPRQVPKYTPDAGAHSWISRFYPGYPLTTKLPKGMPSAIWPMFTPRPTVPPRSSNSADMVTPFVEKLISATSTAATPSVQILGEPSAVEPKYKLAVVSDYKNYDMNDGSFGFSIDLENGLTAKVRGYKKDGKHFIEGSYSLFAKEGDPVNITYVADNEPSEVQRIQLPTTNTIPGSLSLDDSNSNTTPTTET